MSDRVDQFDNSSENREGGVQIAGIIYDSNSNVENQNQNSNAGGAERLSIEEHALTHVAPPPPQVSSLNSIVGQGSAISAFKFPTNPFAHPARPEISRMNQDSAGGGVSSSQPAVSKDSQRGGDHSSADGAILLRFKSLSAKALAKIIGDKIQNFKPEFWIEEDVNGAAFLDVVSPPRLSEFLQQDMLIASKFQRERIEKLLRDMIIMDISLSDVERKKWSERSPEADESVRRLLPVTGENLSPNVQKKLFETPNKIISPVAPFLKEIKSNSEFGLDDANIFSSDHCSSRVTVAGSPHGALSADSLEPSGGFTINFTQQPAVAPNYMILDTVDNPVEFFKWLRKNREESELALPTNRRPLKDLMTKSCKLEIARVILECRSEDPYIFGMESPYPLKGWVEVTDKLILKVLHKKNGPPCASEAKRVLRETKCFFNDATTEQKLFTGKLRKHCQRINEHIENFDYMFRLWPAHDNVLSHAMIIDAFSEGFDDKSTVLGSDNTTQVPKCRNLVKIREMIREKKDLSLQKIQADIIAYFERLDTTIRANPKAKYDVYPWRKSDKPDNAGNKKKRNFNQVEAGGGASGNPNAKKPPRAPTNFPRCANCGSKGHLCGERTCFLFGHPKAKGADYQWAEGEPSVRLDKDEYNVWSKTRKPIFWAYPENKSNSKA
jgi:hypothetical protein